MSLHHFPELTLFSHALGATAALVGETIGAIIGGGGFFIQPALLVAGYTLAQAISLCVATSAGTAISGLFAFARAGRVPWNLAGAMIPASAAGAALGAEILKHMPQKVLAVIFLVAAVLCAWLSWARQKKQVTEGGHATPLRMAGVAFVTSIYIALSSAGSGVMAVILLMRFARCSESDAIILRKFIFIPATFAAVISCLLAGLLDVRILPTLLAASLLAGWLGAHAVMRISNDTLGKLFRIAMLLLAGFAGWKVLAG